MFHRYRYEYGYYAKLERIPLCMRMKLDLTGVKLSLGDWLAFDLAERRVLCHLPYDDREDLKTITDYLEVLAQRYLGRSVAKTQPVDESFWDRSSIPPGVLCRCPAGNAITSEEWNRWPSHQRYALFKTATSKSEPDAFAKLLDEFRERPD